MGRRLQLKWYLALWLLMAWGTAQAGYVELYNGDRIEGDFVRLDGDRLVWASTHFGEVRIPRQNIKNLNTTMPMKISGSATPCLIDGMKQEYLFYTCGGDPDQRSTPLAALDVMLPYESHVEGEYTFTGRFSLNGFVARGNESREDVKARTQIDYRRSELRHAAILEYASYSTNDEPADDVWMVRYNLDWFFRERWFWTNDINVGGDESRGVEDYYNYGSGTGYQFWENSKTALSLTAVLTYLHESYEWPETPTEDFEQVNERLGSRLGVNFRYELPLGISLRHNNEWIRSLDEGSDWRLTSSTSISTMIVGALRSELKVDYNINNQPQPGKRREDTRMSIGISYDW